MNVDRYVAEQCEKCAETLDQIIGSDRGRKALAAHADVMFRVAGIVGGLQQKLMVMLLTSATDEKPPPPREGWVSVVDQMLSSVDVADGVPEDYADQARAIRLRSGYSFRSVESKVGIGRGKLLRWEAGQERPTGDEWAQFLTLRAVRACRQGPGHGGARPYVDGVFQGLMPRNLAICRECESRTFVWRALRDGWPERDLCERHVKVNRAVRSADPEKPWAGIGEDVDVWCDGCDVRMPAGKVRNLWPFPDLCDHCAKDSEPMGMRCQIHGIVGCQLATCQPKPVPTCQECGGALPEGGGVLCNQCLAAQMDANVVNFKHHVLQIESVGNGNGNGNGNGFHAEGERPYIHFKGPNPLSKKRPTGPKGNANTRQEKQAHTHRGRTD